MPSQHMMDVYKEVFFEYIYDVVDEQRSSSMCLGALNGAKIGDIVEIKSPFDSNLFQGDALEIRLLQQPVELYCVESPVFWGLREKDVFDGDEWEKIARWGLFWSVAHAAHEVCATFSRVDLDEEPQNAALFGSIAVSLAATSRLTKSFAPDELRTDLYWADFTKGDVERRTGGDFLVAAALDENTVCVALVQAKKVKENGLADVSYSLKYKDDSSERQLDLFLKFSRRHIAEQNEPDPDSIRGAWCYYLFWHADREGAVLPPTLRTVHSVKAATSKGWSISPVESSIDLVSFLALLLPEKVGTTPRVGLVLTRQEAKDLLADEKIRPARFLGVSRAGTGWHLGYWLDLLDSVPHHRVRAMEGNVSPSEDRMAELLAAAQDPGSAATP